MPREDDSMAPSENVFVIVNPTAGGARRPGTPERLMALLRAEGLHPTLYLTTGPGDAAAAARRTVDLGVQRIGVAAGDGTIGEVLGVLLGSPTAMGILPLGTGNSLGRDLGLPLHNLAEACRIFARGHTRAVDVGLCNGTPFVTMCGCGFDAEVAHAANHGEWKKRFGKWGFLLQAFATIAGQRPRRFRVTVDGQTFEGDLWAAVVCNGSQYSWRLRFAPEGTLDDGLLHVRLFRQRDRGMLVSDVMRHWFSGGEWPIPNTQLLAGRRIRIRSDPPVRWQIDGDVRGMTPVDIELHPQALRLIVRE
jgi:diacylglycerol kinase (ATP)